LVAGVECRASRAESRQNRRAARCVEHRIERDCRL